MFISKQVKDEMYDAIKDNGMFDVDINRYRRVRIQELPIANIVSVGSIHTQGDNISSQSVEEDYHVVIYVGGTDRRDNPVDKLDDYIEFIESKLNLAQNIIVKDSHVVSFLYNGYDMKVDYDGEDMIVICIMKFTLSRFNVLNKT